MVLGFFNIREKDMFTFFGIAISSISRKAPIVLLTDNLTRWWVAGKTLQEYLMPIRTFPIIYGFSGYFEWELLPLPSSPLLPHVNISSPTLVIPFPGVEIRLKSIHRKFKIGWKPYDLLNIQDAIGVSDNKNNDLNPFLKYFSINFRNDFRVEEWWDKEVATRNCGV